MPVSRAADQRTAARRSPAALLPTVINSIITHAGARAADGLAAPGSDGSSAGQRLWQPRWQFPTARVHSCSIYAYAPGSSNVLQRLSRTHGFCLSSAPRAPDRSSTHLPSCKTQPQGASACRDHSNCVGLSTPRILPSEKDRYGCKVRLLVDVVLRPPQHSRTRVSRQLAKHMRLSAGRSTGRPAPAVGTPCEPLTRASDLSRPPLQAPSCTVGYA